MTHAYDRDDFGFVPVSIEEMNAEREKLLETKLSESQSLLQSKHHKQLLGLKNMIMPLLVNLTKDPEKQTLIWPNRAEKAQEFIEKIEKYVQECLSQP